MDTIETLIFLMMSAVILVAFAQQWRLPYPLALVIGGAILGFLPTLSDIYIDPKVLLVAVLPPILYYAAFAISFREFRENLAQIFSLALGLVVVTTLAIGMLFKWIFPDTSWALAFAFGALISPPDATTNAILKRYNMRSGMLTTLEGESLVNDASALVLYKLAIVALISGTFSLWDASIEFAKVTTGGIFVGAVVGWLLQSLSMHFFSPLMAVVVSFVIPYFMYILANTMGFSGVLAVVVSGLISSRLLIVHPTPLRRILGHAAWDIFIILLNCFIFILMGSQLSIITKNMSWSQIVIYGCYGLLITVVLFVIRFLWIASKYIFLWLRQRSHDRLKAAHRQPEVHEALVMAGCGMRGIVSLTAVLALPLYAAYGHPIELRNEVIFMTFIVIFLTLLIPSIALPYYLKTQKTAGNAEGSDVLRTREWLVKAAEKEIQRLNILHNLSDEESLFLIDYFKARHRIFKVIGVEERVTVEEGSGQVHKLESARRKVVRAQRRLLLQMWEQEIIDDKLLNVLERELDVEESHLSSRPEL